MISDLDDEAFERRLEAMERNYPRLLASEHYRPLMLAKGGMAPLEAARIEWRERQERARARRLREEASWADG